MKNINTVSNVDKLVKDIIDAGEVDMFRGSVSSLKDMSKALKEQHKLIEDLTSAGDFSSLKKVLKEQKKDQEAQQQATMDLMQAREKLQTISKEQDKKAYEAQMAHIDGISSNIKRLAQQSNKLQFSVSKTGKEMQSSMDKYERTLKEREERYEDLGKAGAMIEQKFSKRFESSVSAFTGGIGDLESFGATFASSLATLGAYLMVKKGQAAEKASLGGEGSEAAASSAQMLGTLGKVAGTLAIVGGSVLALVKLFQFIEGSVIKANEEILKTASITDLVSAGMGSTNKNLELVRNTFRDADFATEMGMAYDETLALVGQFNQLNMGIKQFGGGKEGMERMKDAMKATKGMAFGLGISMEDAQGYMAKFTHDLGVSAKDGSIVARMAGDFADIRDMALQSSYSTSNFFKKVTELTDQLENMNYRTREAGTLVLRFASVLGKSGLDKALQSLFSGFRTEGYLEQMKRNMLSKSDEVKKALKVEAIKFGKSFGESFGGGKDGSLMGKLMKDQGVADQGGLIKKLANMDEKGRQDLFTRMKKEGGTEEFTDQLYKFIRLARGTKAKATGAEVQGAQEEMGASGNLKTKFALIEARVGDRNMNDAGVVTKEMLTKFGVSKEQIELFGQLQTTMKGDMREAQAIAKKGGKLSDEDDAFLKKQGLDVENGKLVMRETRMAVENFSDYLQTQDEAKFEDPNAPKEAKTQEQYLDEGVAATTSVFNVLNNTIAGILNDISGGIYNMVTHFSGLDDSEKKAQREAQKILGGRIETTSGLKKDQEQKRMLLEKEVASYGFKGKLTGDQKKALGKKKDELKKVKAEEERLKEKENMQKRMLKDLTLHGADVANERSSFYDTDTADLFLGQLETRESKSGKSKKMKSFKAQESSDLEGSDVGSYKELFTKLARGGADEDTARMMAKKGLTFQRSGDHTSLMKGGEELVGTSLTSAPGGVGGPSLSYEERSKEQSITNELLKDLKKPEKKSVRQKQAQEAAEGAKKVNIETQVEAIKKSKDEEKKKELEDVRKALGLGKGASSSDIATAYGQATDKQKKKLTGLSIGGNSVIQSLREITPKDAKDILITNDGQVWKLDTADQMTSMSGGGYAMSKPGGAIDEYIGTRMSGGGGGGGGITINVNGAQNPEEVGRVVRRHIKEYQATLMGTVQ